MAKVDHQNTIPYPLIDTALFSMNSGSAVLQFYAKDKNAITPFYETLKKNAIDYDVYLKANMPVNLHYSTADDRYNRIGDIILLARLPKVFNRGGRPTGPGKHGYDPHHPDMRASFQAWGPAFKKDLRIQGFENIHVYPLIADILGLQYDAARIDGKEEILREVLNKKQETGNK